MTVVADRMLQRTKQQNYKLHSGSAGTHLLGLPAAELLAMVMASPVPGYGWESQPETLSESQGQGHGHEPGLSQGHAHTHRITPFVLLLTI